MKILICGTHFPHCSEMLQKHLPQDTIVSCPADQVLKTATHMDVLVPAMHRVDAHIIAQTSATLIHQFGVGLEGVDIPAATEQSIYVANVPGHQGTGNAASVSEHAIFLMLALARKFPQAAENVRQKVFTLDPPPCAMGTLLGTRKRTRGDIPIGRRTRSSPRQVTVRIP